jgi:protein SCO1
MMRLNFFLHQTWHNALPGSLLYAILFLSLASFSCRSQGGESTASSNAKRYDLKGKVVSVDKAEKRISIEHEEIPGYMDAMTMPFALRKNDYWTLDVLKSGDKVTASLVVDSGLSWIENIVITQESTGAPVSSEKSEAPPEARAGDEVPNFSLINQDGKQIRLAQYRGRALLLTFIYTRCPLPDYCPLMSNNFAAIERELKKNQSLYERTHLLSISFDTAYDTPKVLKSYGGAYTENYTSEKFTHWEFATGTPEEIREIASFFGLSFYKESNQIIHGLRTAIITPDGKVYKVYRGNEWKTEEALRDLQALLSK